MPILEDNMTLQTKDTIDRSLALL